MSEPENFLSRWSRLKRETESAPAAVPAETPADVPVSATSDPRAAVAAGEEAAFDLSRLPSLDSIGADTDISMFMHPGVPSALRHAALRRAWASDPAIRDFRGLQENDWDFNAPDSVPGFGTFKSEDEIRALARRLFGGDDKNERVSQSVPLDSPSEPRTEDPASGVPIDKCQAEPVPVDAGAKEERVAASRPDDENQEQPVAARRHGGALPQ